MVRRLASWLAGRLRFPRLFLLTSVLFVVDLLVPDMIPLADEILLGLTAALLSQIRRPRPPQLRT